MVDEAADLLAGHRFEQEDDDSRIQVAGARPHHESSGRGQAHRRVDGDAVLDRAHRSPVPQMRDDHSTRQAQLGRRPFVREAVEAVAPHPERVHGGRQGKAPRHFGQRAMERGVEAGDRGRTLRRPPHHLGG